MVSGRLEGYGLFDALQIVGARPGGRALEVETVETRVVLRFSGGLLVGAGEPERPEAAAILARLEALGDLPPGGLRAVLARAARSGRPAAEVATTELEVAPTRWAEVAGWRQVDLLASVFTAAAGEFRLTEPEAEPPALGFAGPTPVPVGEVIATGLQLVEAWPRIRRWVPSDALVVQRTRRRTPAPPDPDAPFDAKATEDAAWAETRPGRTAAQIADRVPGPRAWTRWVLAQWVARGDLEWAPLSA